MNTNLKVKSEQKPKYLQSTMTTLNQVAPVGIDWNEGGSVASDQYLSYNPFFSMQFPVDDAKLVNPSYRNCVHFINKLPDEGLLEAANALKVLVTQYRPHHVSAPLSTIPMVNGREIGNEPKFAKTIDMAKAIQNLKATSSEVVDDFDLTNALEDLYFEFGTGLFETIKTDILENRLGDNFSEDLIGALGNLGARSSLVGCINTIASCLQSNSPRLRAAAAVALGKFEPDETVTEKIKKQIQLEDNRIARQLLGSLLREWKS